MLEDFVDVSLSEAADANIFALGELEPVISLLCGEVSLDPAPGTSVYTVVVEEGNISVMLMR